MDVELMEKLIKLLLLLYVIIGLQDANPEAFSETPWPNKEKLFYCFETGNKMSFIKKQALIPSQIIEIGLSIRDC